MIRYLLLIIGVNKHISTTDLDSLAYTSGNNPTTAGYFLAVFDSRGLKYLFSFDRVFSDLNLSPILVERKEPSENLYKDTSDACTGRMTNYEIVFLNNLDSLTLFQGQKGMLGQYNIELRQAYEFDPMKYDREKYGDDYCLADFVNLYVESFIIERLPEFHGVLKNCCNFFVFNVAIADLGVPCVNLACVCPKEDQ